MKRFLVVLVAALALTGVAAAQNAPQLVKLSGKLEVVNGMIGVKDGGTSYLVPRLRGLVGFVKELQEGTAVKLEGYPRPIPTTDASKGNFAMLMVTKLTVAGKDYEFSPMFRQGMRGGKGGGQGCGQGGGQGGGQGCGQGGGQGGGTGYGPPEGGCPGR
jgi:hypothetical protein